MIPGHDAAGIEAVGPVGDRSGGERRPFLPDVIPATEPLQSCWRSQGNVKLASIGRRR